MKIDVAHVAKLANLPLSDEEREKFGKQLSSILDYFEKLNQVDTKKVEPTSQVADLENIFKDDQTRPSLSKEEALSNSKSTHNGYIKVKAILEGE